MRAVFGTFLVALFFVSVACEKPAGTETVEGEIVGYLNGEPITMEELEEAAGPQLIKVDQERHDVLASAFDGIVMERLLEAEAANRGITTDQLLAEEVRGKVPPPSDEQMRAYFEANKARAPAGTTFEAVRADIQQGLHNQKLGERRSAYFRTLHAAADVDLRLDSPRYDVTIADSDVVRGPESAPITIVEFADFECPYCRRAHPALKRILDEYRDQVRFVFRDFPLSIHQRAVPASEAARCADEQGKFWEYYEHLMVTDGDLSDGDLQKRAEATGLDMEQYNDCYQSRRHTGLVRASFDSGRALGVTGTPAFFVNGRMISGMKSYEDWKSIIDDELAEASSSGS